MIGSSDPNSFGGGLYDALHTGGQWVNGTARTAALTAIGSKADLFTEPTTILESASSGATDTFVFQAEKARQIGVSFMVVGADGCNGGAIIWGWRQMEYLGKLSATSTQKAPRKWVATPLIELNFLGGARVVADNQADPLALQNCGSTWRYVDTIDIDVDHTLGDTAGLVADAVDAWSMLVFDPCGNSHIEIETFCNLGGTDPTRILPFYAKM